MNKKTRTISETKPQYAIFDWIVSLPIIRILKPIYELKRGFWIYCFLGFVSTVVDFVLSLVLAKIIPFSATIATTLAFMASTLVSFVLFRYFYFDRTENSFISEFLKFIPTRILTYVIGTALVFIFVDTMGKDLMIIKLISIPITAGINYLTSKFFVFK